MIVGGRDFDEPIARWVADRIPILELEYRDGKRLFTALGWTDDRGELLAGVVLDDFRPPNICLHIAAAPGGAWLNDEFVSACFRFAFGQRGVTRVMGKTPISNQVSLRLQKLLGFKIEGRLRQALLTGEDLILTGMLKSECRWLTRRDDVKRLRAASA